MPDDWPGFEECIKLIRSDDPLTFEDGFHLLMPRVVEFRDQLVALLKSEKKPAIKGRLVELLGETFDPNLVDVLQHTLNQGEPEVIPWALTALEKIGRPEIPAEYRKKHPEWI